MNAMRIAVAGFAIVMTTTYTHLALMARYNAQTIAETWGAIAKETVAPKD
ncbi:MAG: hypothetical protein KDE45_22605 [Caldilineaceae bacterium]|nr:hypothetical protein [Caldilineaceae bacterium]